MNVLDIVICVICGFCLVRGIFRGSIKEITSIVGVIAGFFVAYAYYPVVAKWLSEFMADQSYLNIVSFILTFLILFFAVGFLGVIFKHLLKAAKWGWADRVVGGILGIVKAALIVSVLLVPLTTFLSEDASLVKDSVLAPYVTTASEKIVTVVPKDMKEKFWHNIKVLKASWKKT